MRKEDSVIKSDLDQDRLISPDVSVDDLSLDLNLRPSSLDEFIGQDSIKKNLKIFIQAARNRRDTLDHILFCGPPDLERRRSRI